MTVPKQDPEDYAMHEVAAQAATKKLNPGSLAMRADEAGSAGSPDGVSDRAAQGASLRTRYCLCSGVQTAVMSSRARPCSKCVAMSAGTIQTCTG